MIIRSPVIRSRFYVLYFGHFRIFITTSRLTPVFVRSFDADSYHRPSLMA